MGIMFLKTREFFNEYFIIPTSLSIFPEYISRLTFINISLSQILLVLHQAQVVNVSVVWCDVVWCDVVWCDVVWCGVVWCGVSHVSTGREMFACWVPRLDWSPSVGAGKNGLARPPLEMSTGGGGGGGGSH